MTIDVVYRRSLDAGGLSFRDDGRTVEGCIVPFGQVADVAEVDPKSGELVRYRERFLPGCTERVRQDAAKRGGPTWVRLNLDHDGRMDARIGFATALDERAEGVHATFRLYASDNLAKVRSMLEESHRGLSVEFGDIVPPVVEGGVTSRRQIWIGGVACTPVPCYAGAGITALRQQVDAGAGGTPKLDAVRAWLEADAGATSAT